MINNLVKSSPLILKSYSIFLLLSLVLFTGMKCKKDSTTFETKEQLPAITQEGKNTFGFLLNGDVWLPKAPIIRSKLDLSYDPGYEGGTLNISVYKYTEGFIQQISIGNKNINRIGEYNLFVYYNDSKTQCTYDVNPLFPVGRINISSLDFKKKTISGTFTFKLEKNGCATINATEGRFDMRIE